MREVLSPSTTIHDRTRKMNVYAREGVKHLWFVEPERRTLEVFRLLESRWTVVQVFAGDASVHGEPFEAIALELGRLWLAP